MNKLNVFSKKLGEVMEVSFGADGTLVTPEGIPVKENGIVLAWNNSDSWVDNGWSNSGGNWMDQGWSNSGGVWTDKGWSNSGGNWLDKGWSNSGGKWSDSGSGGSGCYITTACVEHMGLDDNCHELNILREYRDKLVEKDESFRSKVLEYYRRAPLIVQCIDQDADKDTILDDLYENMIRRCVNLLEDGYIEDAKQVYLSSYEGLANRYLAS